MRHHTARTRRGFTMIELLIILGIMGIVITISMNRTTRIVSGWRVDAASRAIADELQAAFSLVGRNRKPLMLQIDTAKMQLRLVSRSGADTFRLRPLGTSSEYKLKASELTVAPNKWPTTLEIYPPGLASDSLSITIKKDGTARRIRMLRGGLVQICKTGLNTQC